MYHPAAALHQASLKVIVEQDFARLPQLLAQVSPQAPEPEEIPPAEKKLPPKQLSLF
jgi:DNA polymerase